MLPIVHGLEKEYAGKINFVRVNILDSNNEGIMDEFGFNTTPELYLLDENGKIIGFWSDFVEAEELRNAFDRALGSETPP